MPFPGVLIEKERRKTQSRASSASETRLASWESDSFKPAFLLIASQPLPSVGAQRRQLERHFTNPRAYPVNTFTQRRMAPAPLA